MPLISQRGRCRRRSHRRWNSGDGARQEVETAGAFCMCAAARVSALSTDSGRHARGTLDIAHKLVSYLDTRTRRRFVCRIRFKGRGHTWLRQRLSR